MKKYYVEFAFAENFCFVDAWDAELMVDGYVEFETAEDAAKCMACTDGLENALFRVYELKPDEFGNLEKYGDYEYFCFD